MTYYPEGQWWERQGYVVYLHPNIDPNSDENFIGWVQITEERAAQVIAERDETA